MKTAPGRCAPWVGAALVAALGAPVVARANPFETIGAGPRASAMLATNAIASDASAVFYNPAGLIHGTDTEIGFGFAYTSLDLEINGRNIDDQPITGSMMTVLYPTDFFDYKVAIGALVYIPTQRAARLLALPLDQPQFLYYGTRNQRLVVMVGGAVEITQGFSVGGGVQTLLNTSSEPDFTLIQDPNPGNDQSDPGANAKEPQSFGFASAVQDPVLSPAFGVQLTANEHLSLGLSYRGEIKAHLSAPFLVTIEELKLLGLTIAQTRFVLPNDAELFFSPQTVSAGVAYTSDDLRVDLDVGWYQYSHFPATFSAATPSFSGGLAELILPVPAFLPIDPPAKDIVVPAIGVEWTALREADFDLALRSGYEYRSTMLRPDRGITNFLDTTAHVIGLGCGVTIRDWSRYVPKPLTLDGYAQVHVLEHRNILKDDPASSPYGDLRLGGLGVGGGVQATVRF